jgi:histidine ammonia-lyase
MGTIAARQAREMIHNAIRVIAIEWICASQAIFLQNAEEQLSSHSLYCLKWLRNFAPPLTEDASISEQIEAVAHALLTRDDWHLDGTALTLA